MKIHFSKIFVSLAALMSLAAVAINPVGASNGAARLDSGQHPHRQGVAYRSGRAAKAALKAVATQGLTATQMEAAVEEYFASIGSLDVQRFVNNFAADGVLEDPVGTPPVQGTAAIGIYFAAIIAPFSEIKPKVQEVIVCGDEAAVNWKLKLTTTTGKRITIDGMGVFKFNAAGKLQSVREFWDLAAFLEQLQN